MCELVKGMTQASADALGASTSIGKRKKGFKANAESFYEKISCKGLPRGGYGQNLASCIWRYGDVSTSDRPGRSGLHASQGASKDQCASKDAKCKVVPIPTSEEFFSQCWFGPTVFLQPLLLWQPLQLRIIFQLRAAHGSASC